MLKDVLECDFYMEPMPELESICITKGQQKRKVCVSCDHPGLQG